MRKEFNLKLFEASHYYSTISELEVMSSVNEQTRLYYTKKELNAQMQPYLVFSVDFNNL